MHQQNVPQNPDRKKKAISTTRRSFIKTAALTGCAAMLTGIPLASYVIVPSLKKGAGKWIDFGAADNLAPDTFTMLSYEFMLKDGWLVLPQRGFVWARPDTGGRVKIFSSTCTHLACNVIWQAETNVFECPCHSGKYDSEGRPIAGPPTKPLTVLDHQIRNGNLQVYLSV